MSCDSEKVVQSRSQITSSGQSTLLQALRVFSPMSVDLPQNEKELVTFIEQLRGEGNKPTILKSKDVYGYKSCTSIIRPMVKLHKTVDTVGPKVQEPCKKRGKQTVDKTEINYASLSPAAKVVLKNQPKILLTNMSQETLKQTVSKPHAFVAGPSNMSTCLKLTNISGPSTGHTARLQFHTGVWTGGVTRSNSHLPLSAQPSDGAISSKKAVSLRRGYSVVCSRSLDTAYRVPLPHVHQNGWVLRESNGMPCWRDQKRKWVEEAEEKLSVKKSSPVWLVKTQEDLKVKQNNLRFKVIKIDDSITDDEVRRKAQKILKVNLSPVIEIQPLIAYPV
ncbi:coiled-coil domain-containing protein 71-like [Hypomesus transpacificus]|uniref:coiled-coil domain-containing protein 71-like n=1 Tax=Hypomesus transpacificus TaxID=137520 RepID=UPI001F0725E7|nr:coiled-coil domain-containing protein 71-like [Hypomesus transpacificus]XP_046895919.1 coiled-coil domain-containing protein 71-like [Hypomesus transpacificus]